MIKGRLHSIETMGLVDGPGIRTVFFLQGCPLRCAYCHNPDTQTFDGDKMIRPEDVVSLAKRYLPYYQKSGGGITFSGGEPLVQGEFLLETLKQLKEIGVCTALDTSGYGAEKYFDEIIKTVSYVILDVKHYDENEHIKLTGRDMKSRNKIMTLIKKYNKRVLIRHVMVPGLTDNYESMDKVYETVRFLSKTIEKIEILPYHKHGVDKYAQLGLDDPLEGVPEMDQTQAEIFQKYINGLLQGNLSKKECVKAK
jgi:pyruvate formate lyase activating enzyme